MIYGAPVLNQICVDLLIMYECLHLFLLQFVCECVGQYNLRPIRLFLLAQYPGMSRRFVLCLSHFDPQFTSSLVPWLLQAI